MTYKYNTIYQKGLKSLEDAMDKRDRFFEELENYFKKHGKIPDTYRADWNVYLANGRKKWREDKKAARRIKKAARKCLKNSSR